MGLIINELVANSAKYAFPGTRRGTIIITLKVHDKECHVCVADDGVGKAVEVKGGGRGLELVEGLAQQLDGSFCMETSIRGNPRQDTLSITQNDSGMLICDTGATFPLR